MPVDLFTNLEDKTDHIIIQHGDSILKVYYFGANITSWKYRGVERLFLSSKAIVTGPKAIRGGIPIVFPQFGPEALPGYKALPQHGFARLVGWEFLGVKQDNAEKCEINFGLKNDALIPDQQRAIWNHEFKLVYTITLQANTLKTSLEVLNSGSSSFTFNALLHTYFKVDNVHHVEIKGLGGYKFKEFSALFELESRPHITISQEVDRVYENVNSPAITLDKSAMGKSLILTKSDGFKDVVVWNPWAENAKKMADFGDEEFNEMICVEVGSVIEPIILSAGKTWNARQVLVAI